MLDQCPADQCSIDAAHARRVIKRTDAIAAVKRTPAYILVSLHSTNRQATPDPQAQMSKRQWEKSMMEWRGLLREGMEDLGRELAHRMPEDRVQLDRPRERSTDN